MFNSPSSEGFNFTTMIKKGARKISKQKAAEIYASIYAEAYQKITRNAFFDGIIFWDMVMSGAITEDMINEDFMEVLINHPTEL